MSRIVRTEGLFGEPCLIAASRDGESATTLDNVMLMGWDRAEIEMRIEQEPRLGIALFEYMVHQCLELKDRIETMAVHKTPERVMLGLLQLATDLGTETEEGSTRVAHLTHDTIAEFVGTSREIVSCQMNRLRRLGLIRYSRRHLDVYSEAMLEELRRQGCPSRAAPKRSCMPPVFKWHDRARYDSQPPTLHSRFEGCLQACGTFGCDGKRRQAEGQRESGAEVLPELSETLPSIG